MANSTTRTFAEADQQFGPFVEPLSSDQFDFTLLFEQSIFSIAPAAALIVLSIPRIVFLYKTKPRVRRSVLLTVKLVLCHLLKNLYRV